MSDTPNLLFILNTVLQHGSEYSMGVPGSEQPITITLQSVQQNGMCVCRTVSGISFETTMEQFIDLMTTSIGQSDDASADVPGDASANVPEVMDGLRL